jgi:hypothetical protein
VGNSPSKRGVFGGFFGSWNSETASRPVGEPPESVNFLIGEDLIGLLGGDSDSFGIIQPHLNPSKAPYGSVSVDKHSSVSRQLFKL